MYKLSKWKTTCIYMQVQKCLVMWIAIRSVEKKYTSAAALNLPPV